MGLFMFFVTAGSRAGKSIPAVVGPSQLYSQTFESDYSGITLNGTNFERVTTNPYAGSYCMRGSFSGVVQDPTTGNTGGSTAYMILNPSALQNSTPDEVYIKFYFRFDDCLWDGSTYTEPGDTPPQVSAKVGYMCLLDDTADSYYPAFVGGASGLFNFTANGWGTWNAATWGNGTLWSMLADTVQPYGTDDTWHSFEMHILYNDPNAVDYLSNPVSAHTLRMWCDGHLLKRPSGYASDGKIGLNPAFHFDTFRFPFTNDTHVDQSACSCGIQFDNIEIYDAHPNE